MLNRAAIYILILLSILMFVACLSAREENNPAPQFVVTDLNGREISLSNYKNKVVLLNFWATTCPPCRAEIPGFIEVYNLLKDKGLEIIGISLDELPPNRLKEWTARAGINYPVAFATRQIVQDYMSGPYIPETILIDRNGRIRFRHVGALSKDDVLRLYEKFASPASKIS